MICKMGNHTVEKYQPFELHQFNCVMPPNQLCQQMHWQIFIANGFHCINWMVFRFALHWINDETRWQRNMFQKGIKWMEMIYNAVDSDLHKKKNCGIYQENKCDNRTPTEWMQTMKFWVNAHKRNDYYCCWYCDENYVFPLKHKLVLAWMSGVSGCTSCCLL